MSDPAMYTNEQLDKLESSCKDVSGWGEINPRVTYRLIELMRAGNQRIATLEGELAETRPYQEFVQEMKTHAGVGNCVSCSLGAFEWKNGCGRKCDAVFFGWYAWQKKRKGK